MAYSDLLKDPRWQRKRLEILNRDNFTCTLCNDDKNTLHVHHKSYEGKWYPWETSNDNLTTYCEICHELVESYKLIPNIKANGILRIDNIWYINVTVISKKINVVIIYKDGKEIIGDFLADNMLEFINAFDS